MAKKVLTTPISAEDLEDIHVGDVIYLTGKLTTCRDVAHRRVIEEGRHPARRPNHPSTRRGRL